MKIRPIFAWYDLWIGIFIDTKRKRAYVFLIPMVGIAIDWRLRNEDHHHCSRQR